MPPAFLLASGDKHKKQRKSLATCKAEYQLNMYTLCHTDITPFHYIFIVASFCFPCFLCLSPDGVFRGGAKRLGLKNDIGCFSMFSSKSKSLITYWEEETKKPQSNAHALRLHYMFKQKSLPPSYLLITTLRVTVLPSTVALTIYVPD